MAKPDWEAIETAYRAGVMSLREIASHHGISEGAIRKRAKRDDWSRDLNARIQQKADDLVRKQEVRKTVRTKAELTERVLIEATAEVIASVRMEHRGEIMFAPDDKGRDRLNETYQKVISLPSRVKSLKDLSDSLKTLIGLEREAWSIGAASEPEKTPLPGKNTDLTTDQAAELYKKMMS
ncbi:hypothetical protein Y618_003763 [Salmonella enterica subsp. enterica]|nr:hypothetical protein [Salmonella enterica subsp. enterica]